MAPDRKEYFPEASTAAETVGWRRDDISIISNEVRSKH